MKVLTTTCVKIMYRDSTNSHRESSVVVVVATGIEKQPNRVHTRYQHVLHLAVHCACYELIPMFVNHHFNGCLALSKQGIY